jgi:steroid delta-isomerase-like uncharacterized protein
MSVQENKERSRRFEEELVNGRNLSLIETWLTPDFIDHTPPPGVPGTLEGWRGLMAAYFAAFPDVRVTVEDLIGEGDKVAVRWTIRGTHLGELEGVPPTGRQVTMGGIEIHRYRDGKIAEVWHYEDTAGLMRQLGVGEGEGGA